jgi:hypothetical protein
LQRPNWRRLNLTTPRRPRRRRAAAGLIYGGRYSNWLEKRSGAWRIAKRVVVMDWNLNQPSSDIRSEGMFRTLQVIRRRDRQDPIYRR